ncbi:Eco57I restriction-modification methylase domain-containing protein [Hydrogenophaga sp. NFH-34]|uniref:Eco57I restriction-modification methylase domain-containing protein n=1 Tax=Hydrogenophaga sp. NFH-34 TaxID=2744446 RepID=UPI001F3FD1AB|nr:hypothetical protein [Hydrogenophaga sp. NFH-34]
MRFNNKDTKAQLSLFDDFAVVAEPPCEVAEMQPVALAVQQAYEEPALVREFFRLDETVLDALRGPRSKALANLKAIETLKACEAERRIPTTEERSTISAYTGWGGLSEVFAKNSELQDIQDKLRELLSVDEYRSAMESVLTAYYTEPHVVRAMWEMVRGYGFTHGRICEPSVGVGHFIGCMPDDMREQSRVMAIDIDPLSAEMTRALYGDRETFVDCTGIEKTSFVDEFDLVIGNVPFGNYRVSDRRLSHLKYPIHEYFVAKALDMVRVGGLVALIVTSSMLDKVGSEGIKKYMLQRGKLLKAIRLPSGAFNRLGGTDVVADIIVLQKRPAALDLDELRRLEPQAADIFDWKRTSFPEAIYCSYFFNNPHHVLGRLEGVKGQYGMKAGVKAHPDWVERLRELAGEKVEICFDPQTNVTLQSAFRVERSMEPSGRKTIWTPGFFFDEDGRLMEVDDHANVSPKDNLPAATLKRLEGMTRIRDLALRLLEADASRSQNAAQIREELNVLYDRFVKVSGFLLSSANRRLFRTDTHAPLLWSLEHWDDEKEVAVKADLFHKSTISAATLAETADTVEDGLALSYNRFGRMDAQFIARAMGVSKSNVIEQLMAKGMAFIDPVSGEAEDATAYLSGNVRVKLQQAKAAAVLEGVFDANVKALEAVQPQWIAFSEIDTKLGAPWISAEQVSDWLKATFGFGNDGQMKYESANVNSVVSTASWSVTCTHEKHEIFRTEWGTQRKSFWDLLRCILNQQTPEVYDEIETSDKKTKRVINRDETLACQVKAEMIQARFMEWLKADHGCVQEVETDYNMRFNSHVNRSYDGSHLVIPGLNPQIELRAAQKDSIWRGIVSGNTLYALAVGGGKTLIQICCAQEYKRLGLASKPVLVVPNHMLEAFAGEYLRAFPRAKVLAMSKDDMQGERCKTILMRAATNDWDCIIVTHSTFGRISVSEDCIKRYIVDFKAKAAESMLGVSDRNMVREVSRAAKVVETRLESLASAARDNELLGFEEIGIDMILVDEADIFKNLFFFTKKKRIPGISSAFSSRALDLFIKSRLVFERRGNKRSGLMFSTATPISNTIAELYIMQTYLQEERLQELDIASFDAWAASFAREVTCVEVKPEGSGYRLHTRFAQFVNVPELMNAFREVAEIRTKAMLKLPEPKLRGGGHTVVAVPASEAQKEYVKGLVTRADDIRSGLVKPDQDNMLCVTGDGRKAALDIRCVLPFEANDPSSKVNECVRNVYAIWKEYQAIKATQLVFCDLSIPGTLGFSVYEHVRDSLVEMGVPKEEIAFAQEWKTDARKAQLHRMVRSGKIRILIGSTELMGFGTNVQDRLIAKHDLDAPWRPRDVEQRDGRIIRQGCMHDEVVIFRYVTEGTFDAYMWQTLERKALFIAQVMENNGVARRVEDVTSQALSFAEVKAMATGNPIVIEKAAVDAEVAKLLAIRAVFNNDQANLRWKLKNEQWSIKYMRESERDLVAWVEAVKFDESAVKVNGVVYSNPEEAGVAIMRRRRMFTEMLRKSKTVSQRSEKVELFEAGNLKVYLESIAGERDHSEWAEVVGADCVDARVAVPYAASDITAWLKEAGMVKQIQERLKSIQLRTESVEEVAKSIANQLDRPFEHEERLQAALARKVEIDEALEIDTDEKSALALAED